MNENRTWRDREGVEKKQEMGREKIPGVETQGRGGMRGGDRAGRKTAEMASERGGVFLKSGLRTEGIPPLPQASPVTGARRGMLRTALCGGCTV